MKALKQVLITASLVLVSSISLAESAPLAFPQGDDLIAAQENIVSKTALDDVFAIANNINLNHQVNGTAHVIGKQLNITAPVAHNLYAAAENLILQAPVAQDVLVVGSNIQLNDDIAGELRALGEVININGDIAGDVLIGGDNVQINGRIGGNLNVSANNLSFGNQAVVDGTITLYEDEQQSHSIPASVADEDRVKRIDTEGMESLEGLGGMEHYQGQFEYHQEAGWKGWISSTLVLSMLAFVLVLVARNFITKAAIKAEDNKVSSLLQGLISLAIVIGSIPLFAITLIGLPVSALLIIGAILLVIMGAIVGSFVVGNMAWQKLRGSAPNTLLALALTCILGAVLTNLLEAIPFIGWPIGLAIVLLGIGAISPWQTKRYS